MDNHIYDEIKYYRRKDAGLPPLTETTLPSKSLMTIEEAVKSAMEILKELKCNKATNT